MTPLDWIKISIVLAIVAAIGGGVWRINDLGSKLELEKANRIVAEETSKANAEAAKTLAKDNQDYLSAISDMQAKQTKRNQEARKREREIRNVDKTKDGGLAPIMLLGLDRLRGNPSPQ